MTQNEKAYLLLKANHHYEKCAMFEDELENHRAIPHSHENFPSPMAEKEYWREYNRLGARVNYHRHRYHALREKAAKED